MADQVSAQRILDVLRARRHGTGMLAASALTLALALGPAARAQDGTPQPTPGPFCALFTADEVSTALGVPVTPISWFGAGSCTWQADFTTGASASLYVRFDGGTIADTVKVYHPGGTDLPMGDATAYYVPDIATLWVEAGGYLLAFELDGAPGEGIDVQAALTALAETAVGRIDLISIPVETPVPQPSFVGDQELVALFPKEIGGQAVQVLSLTGQEMLAQSGSQDANKQITDALTSLGKTIDDFSLGYGTAINGTTGAYALIVAVRVRGRTPRRSSHSSCRC